MARFVATWKKAVAWPRLRQVAAALLGCGALAGFAPAHAEDLRLVTGELPPYATQDRPDEGISLNAVRQAFALVGHSVSYTFKPWARSLEEARNGVWDGTATWGKNPKRDGGFLISDNVLTEQWVFLYRQPPAGAARFDWKSLNDLQGLRIGAVRFNTYTPEFWTLQKAGVLKVEFAKDDLNNLRLLVAGRIDVLPMERNMACALMKTHFKPEETLNLRAHPRLLTEHFTTHLMLSEKLPSSAARMQDFNRGLALYKKTPAYAQSLQLIDCSLSQKTP